MAPGADHGARRLEIRGSIVRKWSPLLAEKRPKERTKNQGRALLSHFLIPVKHEMHAVSPPEFTTLTHNNPLVERFLRWPMVVLLRIGGNWALHKKSG